MPRSGALHSHRSSAPDRRCLVTPLNPELGFFLPAFLSARSAFAPPRDWPVQVQMSDGVHPRHKPRQDSCPRIHVRTPSRGSCSTCTPRAPMLAPTPARHHLASQSTSRPPPLWPCIGAGKRRGLLWRPAAPPARVRLATAPRARQSLQRGRRDRCHRGRLGPGRTRRAAIQPPRLAHRFPDRHRRGPLNPRPLPSSCCGGEGTGVMRRRPLPVPARPASSKREGRVTEWS